MDPRPLRVRVTRALIAGSMAVGSVAVASPARAVVPVGFDDPVSLDSGSVVYATTIADVSGDGLADLIVGNTGVVSESADYTVQVFVQQIDGTLAPPAGYVPTKLEGDQPSLVTAAGDLDDDGDTDIAAGTIQGVDVFLQAGGVLTGPTSYGSPAGEVFDVQVADLNDDGRDDLIYTVPVAASPGDYRVVRRNQNDTGTFDAADVLATYSAPSSVTVAVGDVSGDGQPDIVVGDTSAAGMHVLEQQDDLSFTGTTDARLTNVKVAVFGDVTGDALDDLVVIDGSSLKVMAATAGGALMDPVTYDTGGTPGEVSVEAADLNGDGSTDLAAFAESGTALLFQEGGTLTGPCSAPDLLNGSIGGKEITAIGDLNGDDVPDAVAGGVTADIAMMIGFAPGGAYATSLSLGFTGPSIIQIGKTAKLSGDLTFDVGCVDDGAEVEIWRRAGGGAAVQIGTAPLVPGANGATFDFQDTPPSAGKFHYHVVYAGGSILDAAESDPVTVEVLKKEATVELDVSDRSLRFGEATVLTATLRGPDSGRIAFYAKADGRTRLIDTVRTSDRGKATLKVRPKIHTTYTARFEATATYGPAKSRGENVKVAADVNGVMVKYQRKVSGTAIYKCCRAWFLTWVDPNKAGQSVKVTVQYWNGQAWKSLVAEKDTFKLNDKGAALIYLDIVGGAGFRFRARSTWFSDGLNLGGSSPWVQFKLD